MEEVVEVSFWLTLIPVIQGYRNKDLLSAVLLK